MTSRFLLVRMFYEISTPPVSTTSGAVAGSVGSQLGVECGAVVSLSPVASFVEWPVA